tara:strand:- start:638 stop:1255 length:618 start_codon:yes stop_codon:yes gene_type:complete
MIAYLEGHILRSEDYLIVLKTSANVGYAVNVPLQISEKYSPEEFLSLHIHPNYREDDISLYGFQNLEEKKLFEMLIKTSGVGPKLGLAVLSAITPNQLFDAVQQNNTGVFSQVPGVGKKTAAKLCLDMKDQLKKHSFYGFESGIELESNSETDKDLTEIGGVFSALKNLGYSEKEILSVMKESGNSDMPFEERLKKALSLLTPIR